LVTEVVEVLVEVVSWKVRVEYVYSNLGCDGVTGSGKEVRHPHSVRIPCLPLPIRLCRCLHLIF
jgi:hypothetical protein